MSSKLSSFNWIVYFCTEDTDHQTITLENLTTWEAKQQVKEMLEKSRVVLPAILTNTSIEYQEWDDSLGIGFEFYLVNTENNTYIHGFKAFREEDVMP